MDSIDVLIPITIPPAIADDAVATAAAPKAITGKNLFSLCFGCRYRLTQQNADFIQEDGILGMDFLSKNVIIDLLNNRLLYKAESDYEIVHFTAVQNNSELISMKILEYIERSESATIVHNLAKQDFVDFCFGRLFKTFF